MTLRHYAVFGERLASTIPLPELDEMEEGAARWTVTEADLASMVSARLLGTDVLYEKVEARLYAHASGHRITVDDTGDFDLSSDRSRITVALRPGAWTDFVRAHLTGRVLATAVFLDGLLPLHASAVATRDGAVGFLAPKGTGKSTLALALAAAGAPLICDDTLAVDPRTRLAWPGVHGLRVRADSLGAVGLAGDRQHTRDGKLVVNELGAERISAKPVPLVALYLLVPVEPGTIRTERQLMPAALAAIGVVAHVKIGRMLGATDAATMLQRAAEITGQVPLHQLAVPRDLATLSTTARTVLDWHGGPAS